MSASASSCAPSTKRATIIRRFMRSLLVRRFFQRAVRGAPRHERECGRGLRLFRRLTFEDDQDAQVLVSREAMLGVCLHEDSAALLDSHLLTLHLEDARAFEHDVELVVLVRLLSVGFRGDKYIDPDFEAGGFVDDLIATTGLPKPFSDGCDFEWVHDREPTSPGRSCEGRCLRRPSSSTQPRRSPRPAWW